MGDYVVRLVMRVRTEEDNPDEAVRIFVDNLVDNGLTNWLYRVDDNTTDEVLGFYNGHGIEVDVNMLSLPEENAGEKKAEQKVETTPNLPEPTSPATPNPGSDDEDLIRLAVTLNAGDKPQEES